MMPIVWLVNFVRKKMMFQVPTAYVWPVVGETPIVPSDKSAYLMTQPIVADVKMAAISTMTALWVQPASMATVPILASILMNVVPTQSAKLFRIHLHASAPRVPESSIHHMWLVFQPRWTCQPSVVSETVIVHLV